MLWSMINTDDDLRFIDAVCARTARLRIQRGWTQAQMATALGVPLERYKKWETRSAMPLQHLPRFAQIMECSIEYLVTGQAPKAERGRAELVRSHNAA